MKKIMPYLLTLVVLLPSLSKAELRTWTTARGSQLEAEFVKLNMNTVVLADAEGTQRSIAFNQLSGEDQKWVRAQTQPQLKAAEPTEAEVPAVLKDFFGTKLIDAKKARHSPAELSGKKIGIYFSAHWCPPCRAFTPELVKAYNQMKADGKPFEIVFASSDKDSGAMIGYMKEMDMPWLALPHGSKEKEALSQKFNVRGIPTLIIIDDQGKTLSANGRGDVASKGAAAFDGW